MLAKMQLPRRREAAQERNRRMERVNTWLRVLRIAALKSRSVKVTYASLGCVGCELLSPCRSSMRPVATGCLSCVKLLLQCCTPLSPNGWYQDQRRPTARCMLS